MPSLEDGGELLDGALGDGKGKCASCATECRRIVVMFLNHERDGLEVARTWSAASDGDGT